MDEINNTTNCKLCGAPLNKKELMTSEIYDDAICDICMGKQRRTELAKDNYRNKLATVPSVYTECKWNEQSLSPWYGKSSVITAEESPLVGTQLAWDLIKLNWRNGKDAIYASSKDIAIENPNEYKELIRNSSVWKQKEMPSPRQIIRGPRITSQYDDYVGLFLNNDVFCETDADDQN